MRKARQLEVDYLNKMRVFERVPHEVAKARMRKEPIKVRWVDTLNGSPLAGAVYSRMVPYPYVALVSLTLSPRERTTTQNSRMVRRGYDRHLHGQRLVPPESAQAAVPATSCRPTVHHHFEGCAIQSCCANLKERSPSVTVASLCVPPARARPQVLPFSRQGCVGEVPRCCFG